MEEKCSAGVDCELPTETISDSTAPFWYDEVDVRDCPPGYYFGRNSCELCPPNTFKATNGSDLGECRPCWAGTPSIHGNGSIGVSTIFEVEVEEVGVADMRLFIGTSPRGDQVLSDFSIHELSTTHVLSDSVLSSLGSQMAPLHATLLVTNDAGLKGMRTAQTPVIDRQPPFGGRVYAGAACGDMRHTQFSGYASRVHVAWLGFEDTNNEVDGYDVCAGSEPYSCDILGWMQLNKTDRACLDIPGGFSAGDHYYVSSSTCAIFIQLIVLLR